MLICMYMYQKIHVQAYVLAYATQIDTPAVDAVDQVADLNMRHVPCLDLAPYPAPKSTSAALC